MQNIPVLDFRPKKPTHQEQMEGLGAYMQRELQVIHDHMTFLHETQIVVLRRLADKKILTPPRLVEMGYEQLANNAFRLLMNELNDKYLLDHQGAQKVEVKRSFWHKVKDFFRGKNTAPQLTVEQQKDDPAGTSGAN